MTGSEGASGPGPDATEERPLRRPSRSQAPLVDALAVDHYLDSLLADGHRGVPDGHAGTPGERRGTADVLVGSDVDPAVRRAAGRLRLELVRVHPSFRFEDRLALRLADAARRMKLPAAAGAEGMVVTIPLAADAPGDAGASGASSPGATAEQPAHAVSGGPVVGGGPFAGLPDASSVIAGLPRPLVIGGALTSAAISIAGAYVAWRAWPGLRPASPMARAVRAARQARAIPLQGAAAVDVAGIVARARRQARFDVIGAAGMLVARTRARLD